MNTPFNHAAAPHPQQQLPAPWSQRMGHSWRALLAWLQPEAHHPIAGAAERRLEPVLLPAPLPHPCRPRPARALVKVAPGDLRCTRISGRMAEVCETLDLMVAREAAALH